MAAWDVEAGEATLIPPVDRGRDCSISAESKEGKKMGGCFLSSPPLPPSSSLLAELKKWATMNGGMLSKKAMCGK